MSVEIESRALDGRVWLAATDVAAALRDRAGEYTAEARSLGDPIPDDYLDTALAYHATAIELSQRADAIDCAVIEYISD